MVVFGLLAIVVAMSGTTVEPELVHPLHNSLMEVSHDAGRRSLEVSLRVFADDFTMAAKGRPASDSVQAIVAYARSSITVADPSGRPITMGFCGIKHVGDMIWICFRGSDTTGGKGLRISSRVLFDHFSDQVNLVRVSYSGRSAMLMFTLGDGDRIVR
jgi:hypothetical protein